MKKIISIVISLAVIISSFCACNKKPDTVSSEAVSSNQSSQDSDKVKPVFKDSNAAFKHGDALTGENKRITNLSFVTEGTKTYEKIELKTDIEGLSQDLNVYNEKDVDLSVALTSSSGKSIALPGFYYEEYKFSDKGQNMGRSGEKADFRFRISLTEPGSWDFVVTLKIKGETVDRVSGYINAEENKENHGYLSVEPKRKQGFMFTDGTLFTAIGENIAYSANNTSTQSMRSAQMIDWMKKCAEYGSNFTRIWLIQWFLSLQKTGCAPDDLSGGMSDAAQIDRIFDAWEEMGMYGQFCLFSFNQLNNAEDNVEAAWSVFPYSSDTKHGYLKKPTDFFTNEKAIEDTKTYLRYLVARYSYSTNLHSWELFNEIDGAAGYADNFEQAVEWHKTMCDYIRSIDPYGHMITTSTAIKSDAINAHSMFDFASIHYYNYQKIEEISNFQIEFWQLNSKPVMFGECGISSVQLDEDLVTFHQQNWAGVMGCGAGTAASWYWENLDSIGGYWDFRVVSEMADHIPWNSKTFFTLSTDNIKPDNDKIRALGYRGEDFAYIWLYDSEFTQLSKKVTDIENLKFSVKLKDGDYHVRWINTWTGVSISQTEAKAQNGVLEVTAPTWNKDVAVAITVD